MISPSEGKEKIRWIHSLKEFNEWINEYVKSLPPIKYEIVFDDICFVCLQPLTIEQQRTGVGADCSNGLIKEDEN